jgi:hypothetical protein
MTRPNHRSVATLPAVAGAAAAALQVAGPWLVGDRLRFAAIHGLSRAWLSGPSP